MICEWDLKKVPEGLWIINGDFNGFYGKVFDNGVSCKKIRQSFNLTTLLIKTSFWTGFTQVNTVFLKSITDLAIFLL